jgi:hypothetical protein
MILGSTKSLTEMSKVKESIYRPGQAQSVRTYSDTHLCKRSSRNQGHSAASSIKSIKIIPSAIEPVTFRLLAQSINNCVPHRNRYQGITL